MFIGTISGIDILSRASFHKTIRNILWEDLFDGIYGIYRIMLKTKFCSIILCIKK
jgi:hypothetical protein